MIVLSIKTMESRLNMLSVNIKSIIKNQKYFDKILIVIDNNFSDKAKQQVFNFKKLSKKIEIEYCEYKWRSCNKLLVALKKYPDADIITCDDDIYYPRDTFSELIKAHKKYHNYIIAHQSSTVYIPDNISIDNFVQYTYNHVSESLRINYDKYLTNCCLFPAHAFDNTDVLNYDKMYELTDGLHDELWFWVNTTLKHIPAVTLDYAVGFDDDVKISYKAGDFKLANTICKSDYIIKVYLKLNELYGKQLSTIIKNEPTTFIIRNDNIFTFGFFMKDITRYYKNINILFDNNITITNKNLFLKMLCCYNIVKYINSCKYKNYEYKQELQYIPDEEHYLQLKHNNKISF